MMKHKLFKLLLCMLLCFAFLLCLLSCEEDDLSTAGTAESASGAQSEETTTQKVVETTNQTTDRWSQDYK